MIAQRLQIGVNIENYLNNGILPTTSPFLVKIFRNGDTGQNFSVSVTRSPHNNCQTYSIASFYLLIHYGVENKLEILKDIQKYCAGGKRQLLLDINQKYIPNVKEIFDKDIIFIQNYKSTNGSKMAIVLTKTDKLL